MEDNWSLVASFIALPALSARTARMQARKKESIFKTRVPMVKNKKANFWQHWGASQMRNLPATEGSGWESKKQKIELFWLHARSHLDMFTLNPFVCPKVKPGEILPFCHPPAVCLAVCFVVMLSWKNPSTTSSSHHLLKLTLNKP